MPEGSVRRDGMGNPSRVASQRGAGGPATCYNPGLSRPRKSASVPSKPASTRAQEKAIQKADTLIEALGWIRKFRDTTTVIKLGGSVLEHPDALRHLLLDIVLMTTLGMLTNQLPREMSLI